MKTIDILISHKQRLIEQHASNRRVVVALNNEIKQLQEVNRYIEDLKNDYTELKKSLNIESEKAEKLELIAYRYGLQPYELKLMLNKDIQTLEKELITALEENRIKIPQSILDFYEPNR